MNIPKYATIGEIPTSYVAPIIQVGDEVYSWSGSQYAPPGVSAAPGSPSAPFASEAQRTAWATANLATLLPGRSTVWGPGAVEYVWNGPLATDWEGIRGPYPGSPDNPFASTAEIVAAGVGATETPWVLNPLAPLGRTQAYFAGGVWAPIPGQCIALYRGVAGQPLVDMTATGRAPATWYEVWAPTDPIPDWLIPNFRDIGLRVRAETKEATNAGTSKLRATLRAESSVLGGETDAIMGSSFTGSEFGRGLYAGIAYAQRSGALIVGSSGTGPFTASVGADREVGTFAAGATKPRLDAQFGLVTNTLKLFSVSIWAGA